MKTYRLVLIGFGNVGQGMAQIMRDRGDILAERFGLHLQIVAVCDLLKGSLYNPAGIDPGELLDAVEDKGHLRDIAAPKRGWDALETIQRSAADVVVELSYTDLESGEPAFSHIKTALENERHVVTTNKGPVALYYPHLTGLARAHNVQIGVEGTVMSGTPAVRLGLEQLAGAGINKVQGILNGTTNYILTQMEAGAPYEEALAAAQAKGYAEADPTGDVEGFDAAGKVVILANLLMGQPLTMGHVARQGITQLTPADIRDAQEAGERWKLIGSVEKKDGQVIASVKPQRLPLSHPLAAVGGATNAITYTTDLLGDVTLVGPGAGRVETGYALIGDILAIQRTS